MSTVILSGRPARPRPKSAPRRHGGRRVGRRLRALGVLLATTALGAWLWGLWAHGEVRPGTPLGTAFGILAAALLALAMLYGVRRRAVAFSSRWRLGSARSWLLAHVDAGLLFLLALLLHVGLRWPEGLFSWTLWGLSVWTVASGLAGLAIQRTVPKLLAGGPAIEVHHDRIPDLVDEVRRRSEELAAGGGAYLQSFYQQRLAPELAAPRRLPITTFHAGVTRRRLAPLEHLRTLVPEEAERFDELESLLQLKQDLDVHFTLQRVLRRWLWAHVPAAALLFVLVAVHIVTALYY